MTLVGHPFDTLKVRLQTQPVDKPIYCEWFANSVAADSAAVALHMQRPE